MSVSSVPWASSRRFPTRQFDSGPPTPRVHEKIEELVRQWQEGLSTDNARDPTPQNVLSLADDFRSSPSSEDESIVSESERTEALTKEALDRLQKSFSRQDPPRAPILRPLPIPNIPQLSPPPPIGEAALDESTQDKPTLERQWMNHCTDIALTGNVNTAYQIASSLVLTTTFKVPLQILCMKLQKERRSDLVEEIITLIPDKRLQKAIRTSMSENRTDYDNW